VTSAREYRRSAGEQTRKEPLVHPTERLRAVARSSGDNALLAGEAASALASFAEIEDSRALLVACRRVLAHHPACGPLWWLCARLLAAADPPGTARESAALLGGDRTARHLAAALPLLDPDGVVAVIGWPDAVDEALAARADIAAVAVQVEGEDPAPALLDGRVQRSISVVSTMELAALTVERVLVAATAIGGGLAVVPLGTGEVIDSVGSRPDTWLVGGVGTALPPPLADAMRAAVARVVTGELRIEVLPLEIFDRVAGPRGVTAPRDALAGIECPSPLELLRPL